MTPELTIPHTDVPLHSRDIDFKPLTTEFSSHGNNMPNTSAILISRIYLFGALPIGYNIAY